MTSANLPRNRPRHLPHQLQEAQVPMLIDYYILLLYMLLEAQGDKSLYFELSGDLKYLTESPGSFQPLFSAPPLFNASNKRLEPRLYLLMAETPHALR